MYITAHAALLKVECNSIFTPINSTIRIHPKQWYVYGGEHGTFNAVFSINNKITTTSFYE
jgi:hypothetical protein